MDALAFCQWSTCYINFFLRYGLENRFFFLAKSKKLFLKVLSELNMFAVDCVVS